MMADTVAMIWHKEHLDAHVLRVNDFVSWTVDKACREFDSRSWLMAIVLNMVASNSPKLATNSWQSPRQSVQSEILELKQPNGNNVTGH